VTLQNVARLTSWPAPTASNGTGAGHQGREGGFNLQTAAALASWNTPIANDAEKRGQVLAGAGLAGQAQMTTWATPTANENSGCLEKKAARRAAQKIKWKGKTGNGFGQSTPTARDWRSDRSRRTSEEQYGSKGQPLARQTLYVVSGEGPTGCSAETQTDQSGELLRAGHSRWLQGIRAAWDRCAPTETPSTRKSRPSS
jgi:hypothetical protein